MYKLNIIVYVPELETKYDVLIPIDKKVSTILYLLKKGIKDLANLKLKSNVKLYEKTTGKVLNNNLTIKENGLQNGSSIIFIKRRIGKWVETKFLQIWQI